MPKRPCTNRAQWRLVRGQASQRLSPHYQLDCDYGTSLTAIYKEGDAVFLCEAHSTTLSALDGVPIAGVRLMSTQLPDADTLQTNDKEEGGLPALTPTDAPSLDGESKIAEATQAADVLAQADISKPSAINVRSNARLTVARGSVRDVTFGDCAKALVSEAIWNLEPGNLAAYRTALQQGRSVTEAAEAAGGQLAIVHRKIMEYTVKLDAILAESEVTLNASEIVDCPLEKAMLEIIENAKLDEAAKDAAIGQLGEFQKWISSEHGRQIGPREAHQLACSVGDRANWGIRSRSVEELKPAYSIVYKSLRQAVLSAVPASRDVAERLANLYAAKCTLETELSQKAYSVAP